MFECSLISEEQSINEKQWKLTMFTNVFEQFLYFFIWQIVSEFSHDVTEIVWIDKSIFVSIECNKRVFQFYKNTKKKS